MQPVPKVPTNPSCRQHRCKERADARITDGRGVCSELFPEQGTRTTSPTQRPCSEKSSTKLIMQVNHLAAARLRVDGGVSSLVQPPAAPQLDQMCDVLPAPKWCHQDRLQAPSGWIRDRSPCPSITLELNHPLLESFGKSCQQTCGRARTFQALSLFSSPEWSNNFFEAIVTKSSKKGRTYWTDTQNCWPEK